MVLHQVYYSEEQEVGRLTVWETEEVRKVVTAVPKIDAVLVE